MSHLKFDDRHREGPAPVSGAPRTGRRSATRSAVTRAWHGVADAALRLHRYRYVRARMLHDVLDGERDGGPADDAR